MGMADVVPGVSGGTIAFITGIYEELIGTISKIDQEALKVLFKEGIGAFMTHINARFLISLGLGIGLSIFSLARLITHSLKTYPVLVWSFFFGLILASAVYIGRQISWRSMPNVLVAALGTAIALWIGMSTPSGGDVGLPYVFLSGAIAICAMILPGISGSFILLLMGSYATIFGALGHLSEDFSTNIPIVAVFAIGALVGLLSFSKILKYLFAKQRELTLAVLTGFMLGSLWKVWPWKKTISTRINSKGEEVPLIQDNVSPEMYEKLVGDSHQLGFALILAALGVAIVFLLALIDSKRTDHDTA